MLDVSVGRAKILKRLADFQNIPSIGSKLAEKLIFVLNVFSLSEIKAKDGAELFDELEQTLGVD